MKNGQLGHPDILQILVVDEQLLQNILTSDLSMLHNEVQKRIKVDPLKGPATDLSQSAPLKGFELQLLHAF